MGELRLKQLEKQLEKFEIQREKNINRYIIPYDIKISTLRDKIELEESKNDLCPDCSKPLIAKASGGVKCSSCSYWFCF